MGIEDVSYRQVPATDLYTGECVTDNTFDGHCQYSKLHWIKGNLAYGFLFLIIAIQSITIILQQVKSHNACTSLHGMNLERTEPRTIYQHSAYVSSNTTEANAAWAAILPGHGVVAITPEYAASKNLPPSIELPNTHSKHAYVIEAYHAIHCIKNLREHYLALQTNTAWSWSHPHDLHCFDALRQYVMCNIDDTLLHTWGKRDSGHNQVKMCMNWERLREWAGKRAAGYFDTEPGLGLEHVGEIWVGDGLPVGGLS